jgi:branched-chain amino acid transport system ATP-binding protein
VAVALERKLLSRNALAAAVWSPRARRSERRAQRRVEHLVELLGLGAFADKFVNELSTGSRRLVDLACVMAAEPTVLLLDEPSSGMAQAETEMLGPVVRRLARETNAAVLVIEHDIPLVTGVSDRLVAMELGAVLAEGRPPEVLADPRVVRAYLSPDASVLGRSGQLVEDALAALHVGGAHDEGDEEWRR